MCFIFIKIGDEIFKGDISLEIIKDRLKFLSLISEACNLGLEYVLKNVSEFLAECFPLHCNKYNNKEFNLRDTNKSISINVHTFREKSIFFNPSSKKIYKNYYLIENNIGYLSLI